MWKSLSWGMSTVCGQQKLRELHQALPELAIAARAAALTSDLRTDELPGWGLTASRTYHPKGVVSSGSGDRFRQIRPVPSRCGDPPLCRRTDSRRGGDDGRAGVERYWI